MHKVGTRRYILLQVSRYIFMSVLSNHRSCTYLRYFYSATAALTLDTRIPSEAAPPAPQPHHPQSHTQLSYLHQTRICQPPFSTCQLNPFACHKNYSLPGTLTFYLPTLPYTHKQQQRQQHHGLVRQPRCRPRITPDSSSLCHYRSGNLCIRYACLYDETNKSHS